MYRNIEKNSSCRAPCRSDSQPALNKSLRTKTVQTTTMNINKYEHTADDDDDIKKPRNENETSRTMKTNNKKREGSGSRIIPTH